jgi:hypothetical protein
VAGVPVKVIEDVPPLLENTGLYAVGVGSVAGAPEGPCGPVAPVGPVLPVAPAGPEGPTIPAIFTTAGVIVLGTILTILAIR